MNNITNIAEQLSGLAKPTYAKLIGFPGTGKSTIVEKLRDSMGEGLVVISTDDSRDAIYRKRHAREKVADRDPRIYGAIPIEVVLADMEWATVHAFALGKIVLEDSTGLSRDWQSTFREKSVERIRTVLGAETVVALDCQGSVEQALEGNALRRTESGGLVFVDPKDIELMSLYRQAHPITPEAPGVFDRVIMVPYHAE